MLINRENETLSTFWELNGSLFEQTWILFTQIYFVEIWSKLYSGSGEEGFFFKFVSVFSLFFNYLPLEKGGTLVLNKLEFPSIKDALC